MIETKIAGLADPKKRERRRSISIIQLMMGAAIVVVCAVAAMTLGIARKLDRTVNRLGIVTDPPYYVDEGVMAFSTTAKTEMAGDRYTFVVKEVTTSKNIVGINRPVYVVAKEINDNKDMELVSASYNPHVPGRILLIFRKRD